MSNNGQKLHNMIIKYNLHVINSMEICTGIFTRVNNKIIVGKSVLDYIIASDDLLTYIKNMQIDIALHWQIRGVKAVYQAIFVLYAWIFELKFCLWQ